MAATAIMGEVRRGEGEKYVRGNKKKKGRGEKKEGEREKKKGRGGGKKGKGRNVCER